jgi:hypothetical protein
MSQRFWLPASLCLLTACPTTQVGADADSSVDVATSEQLRVAWTARPDPIPGSAGSNTTVEHAVFRTRDLRVIGDVTPAPLARFALEWGTGVPPMARAFPDAQLGTYSRLLFSLDPGSDRFSYEISGHTEVQNVTYAYVIRDPQPASVALDFTITLPPGGAATIPVRVEVDKLVNRVDFRQVALVDNQLVVDDTSSQIAGVRNQLAQAFGVHDDD